MEKIKINIRPLSVNEAFTGRRFHTKEHKSWTKSVLFLLPKIKMPEPPFEIYLKYGFSSASSDFDNPTKQVVDSLAAKYGFNDKLIRRAVIETEIVPKGREYFEFLITHFTQNS